jgi:hypothetical protein
MSFATPVTPVTPVTIASTGILDATIGMGGTTTFSVASRFNASDASAVLSL